MENLIDQYIEIQKKYKEYEKKLEHIKTKLKMIMKKDNKKKMEINGYVMDLNLRYRTDINRKELPEEIYEKYSVKTPYEILTIKKI